MGRTHSTTTSITRRTSAAAAGLVVATVLAGCAGDDDDARSLSVETASAVVDQTAGPATNTPPGEAEPSAGAGQAPGTEAAAVDWASIGRDVIVELHVQMESDDIARTVAAITADAVSADGGVASSDINYGTENADGEPNRDGYAVMVVKLPPSEVANLLTSLDASGRVTAVNQSAQDVTEQLVDLDVRIENARESVENVRRFMEQTTNLTDLVSLEAELTRRQTELEQLEAQQRNLSDRVALSTVTIEVRPAPAEAAAVPDVEADEDTIGEAFRRGWDAFGDIAFGIAFVLAALAPFIVTGLVLAFVAWIATRVRRHAQPSPAPIETTDDELTPV